MHTRARGNKHTEKTPATPATSATQARVCVYPRKSVRNWHTAAINPGRNQLGKKTANPRQNGGKPHFRAFL